MRYILCCYADGRLRPETQTAIEASGRPYQFEKVDGEYAYWETMLRHFAMRETFLNVEHDIVPSHEAIESLLDCPQQFCYVPYTYLKMARWWELWREFIDKGERGDVRGAMQSLTDAIWAVNCQGLGCVKFGDKLLSDRRDTLANIPRTHWQVLDGAIYNALGYIEAHVHPYHAKHVDHIDWHVPDQTIGARKEWKVTA